MASESFVASWTYIKRRGTLFFMSVVFTVVLVPVKVLGSLANRRNGAAYFADPLGKPSLLTYWRSLADFSFDTLFLRLRRPADLAHAAVEDSGDGVAVVDKGTHMEFTPPGQRQEQEPAANGATDQPPLVGVVILPGAFVPPLAYAPLARELAQKGYPSYIVRFDFDVAFYGWERIGEIVTPVTTSPTADDNATAAADITAERKGKAEVCRVTSSTTPTKWVLVGHSLGTAAIEACYPKNSAHVHGVVYMGSGNLIGDALAGADVPAMILRGSRDPFTLPEAMVKSAHKLPKDTETVVIEGGNHRGFAHYDRQPLDWEATITPQEQQGIVVNALIDFIGRRVVAGETITVSTST